MTNIVKFLFFCGFMSTIIWFVVVQVNPQALCVTHPQKSGYWSCRPFGIAMEKSELPLRNSTNKGKRK